MAFLQPTFVIQGVDVSATTAEEADVLDGEIFYKADGTQAEGTLVPLDISDANAAEGDVLASKTFYAGNETKKTGTMTDRGTVNTDITTKSQEVTIASGKHSGSGKVKISATEQEKIIAGNIKKDITVLGVTGTYEGGGDLPSTGAQSIFTGATVPLTYRNNTHDYENNYEYKSATHNITIDGLDGRATITGNGTKNVSVAFDVTSGTSSLKNFTITCVNGEQELVYKGMHAHYGTNVTGILTFAYTNITKDGGEGTIGTNYKFIETDSTTMPSFSAATTLWNTIYSYQVLNTLIGNYSATSIGTDFLRYCYSFNQPLTIPNDVTSIGTDFLRYCYSFNQPLTIPNDVTSIGDNFLYYCYSFNQPLTILSGVESIGNYFLASCYSFNQPLTIPSSVTSIGTDFLYSCYSFNQPLTIPSSVTSIGIYFLRFCYSFNQPLTIPSSVTSIGDNFLYSCYSFNRPLTILSGVESIGSNFLSSCYSFNQPLTIPSSVTSIGISFLSSCGSFNQPLTIPSSVTSIGSYFLYSCYSLSVLLFNASVYPTDNNSLSQSDNSKPKSTSGAGIIIYGSQRANLMTALPNRTSTPFRKLIDGGS